MDGGNEHYFIGLTPQTATGGLSRLAMGGAPILPARAVYPSREQFDRLIAPIKTLLDADHDVLEAVAKPVLGRYGVSQEISVGLDILARPSFDPMELTIEVFRQARRAGQIDAFVGRSLAADEWCDNARPGLSVQFSSPQRIASLQRFKHELNQFQDIGWPIDGFTLKASGQGRFGWVAGLRYVFLPEISVRWDQALADRLAEDDLEIDIILLDQATRIGRLCQTLGREPTIADARLHWFDVIVAGCEDYNEMIDQLERNGHAVQRADDSMTRRPFSEILDLTNQLAVRRRLPNLDKQTNPPLSRGQAQVG